MQTDAELSPFRRFPRKGPEAILDVHGKADRPGHAVEKDQHAIAGGLHELAAVMPRLIAKQAEAILHESEGSDLVEGD